MPKFGSMADLVGYALERASSDPDKAEDVLKFYCHAVKFGGIPDQRVMDYLAKCFDRILEGTPADVALGLVRAKGQRSQRFHEKNDEEDYDLARLVWRLKKKGVLLPEAIERVAKIKSRATKTTVPEGRVKKAWDAFGRAVRNRGD